MVVAELRFVEVERELAGADAVVLEELALRVAPEAFEPVDVHLTARGGPHEFACVIHAQMAIPAEGERIVALPAIRIDQAPALDRLEGLREQTLCAAIAHHGDLHVPAALE